MHSNRIFNVNGQGRRALGLAIALAYAQHDSRDNEAHSFINDQTLGLILLDHSAKPRANREPFKANIGKFLIPMHVEAMAETVWEWLERDPEIVFSKEDSMHDIEGDTKPGWRVYLEPAYKILQNYNAHPSQVIAIIKPTCLEFHK